MPGHFGLFPAQKHATAAALTRLEKEDDVIIVGEMGTGKTTIGIATAAGRQAKKTIVLCPPHLIEKWQREAKTVWPNVNTIHLERPSDVDKFFNHPKEKPIIGVLKQTTARSATGWQHTYHLNGPAGHDIDYKNPRRFWGNDWNPPPTFTDRQRLALITSAIRCPVCGRQVTTDDKKGEVLISAQDLNKAQQKCPKCKSPLYQFTRTEHNEGSYKIFAEREAIIREQISKEQPNLSWIPKWLLEPKRTKLLNARRLRLPELSPAKVPLAWYIKKVARRRLDLLIIDEVHQYKAQDSDQGYAMHHLAQTAKKKIALTGTIYGGRASSIFQILFRTSSEMRREFIDNEQTGQKRILAKAWIERYGILEQIETVTYDETGKQTGNNRGNTRYRELPSSSPAMLPWILNRAVFVSLTDMGFNLPEYTEHHIEVKMNPIQQTHYNLLETELKEELKKRLLKGDKRLLSAYLYALLFWPDSPRRTKVVTDPSTDKVIATAPAMPATFIGPKEEAIIKQCMQEKQNGRKVFLFCQQTDTLDI